MTSPDRVDVTDYQIVEAVRMELDVYQPADMADGAARLRPASPVSPVAPIFLDLPLLRGDEEPHAPHVAVTASRWSGPVAIYDSSTDQDYRLNSVVHGQSIVGITETSLAPAIPGRIDRGPALRVRLVSGGLQSIPEDAMLAGGNLIAIGDGTPGNWEVLQFRDAQLLEDGSWALSHRLRGQAGSDALASLGWPAGSIVVLLDGMPVQIGLAAGQRHVERHFRIGPSRRPYDDASYTHRTAAFVGNGLRPYRPAHLVVHETEEGARITWIRRTRIGGDDWDGYDVPLGEEVERYLVRVLSGETVVREFVVDEPAWLYDHAAKAEDGVSGAFSVAVAQISAQYGPGPFAELDVA